MSYLADITLPLVKTLKHFSSLPVHQLAGHAANFQFWKSEVEHRKHLIETYRGRFERLRDAQQEYGKLHGFGNETEFSSFTDEYITVPINSETPLRANLPDAERKDLLKQLDAAFHAFHERLKRESLLEESIS